MTDEQAPPRIEIISGQPTPEEMAALTVAVLGLATGPAHRAERVTPAWARASRIEATGQAPFASSRDPRLGRRPSGALPPAAERPTTS